MAERTLADLEYDLELERVVKEIKKQKAKKVLIQLPDGLKPFATSIVEELNQRINCKIFIWLGSCYGGCDVPLETEKLGIDLIVQFGHSPWDFKDKSKKKISVL